MGAQCSSQCVEGRGKRRHRHGYSNNGGNNPRGRSRVRKISVEGLKKVERRSSSPVVGLRRVSSSPVRGGSPKRRMSSPMTAKGSWKQSPTLVRKHSSKVRLRRGSSSRRASRSYQASTDSRSPSPSSRSPSPSPSPPHSPPMGPLDDWMSGESDSYDPMFSTPSEVRALMSSVEESINSSKASMSPDDAASVHARKARLKLIKLLSSHLYFEDLGHCFLRGKKYATFATFYQFLAKLVGLSGGACRQELSCLFDSISEKCPKSVEGEKVATALTFNALMREGIVIIAKSYIKGDKENGFDVDFPDEMEVVVRYRNCASQWVSQTELLSNSIQQLWKHDSGALDWWVACAKLQRVLRFMGISGGAFLRPMGVDLSPIIYREFNKRVIKSDKSFIYFCYNSIKAILDAGNGARRKASLGDLCHNIDFGFTSPGMSISNHSTAVKLHSFMSIPGSVETMCGSLNPEDTQSMQAALSILRRIGQEAHCDITMLFCWVAVELYKCYYCIIPKDGLPSILRTSINLMIEFFERGAKVTIEQSGMEVAKKSRKSVITVAFPGGRDIPEEEEALVRGFDCEEVESCYDSEDDAGMDHNSNGMKLKAIHQFKNSPLALKLSTWKAFKMLDSVHAGELDDIDVRLLFTLLQSSMRVNLLEYRDALADRIKNNRPKQGFFSFTDAYTIVKAHIVHLQQILSITATPIPGVVVDCLEGVKGNKSRLLSIAQNRLLLRRTINEELNSSVGRKEAMLDVERDTFLTIFNLLCKRSGCNYDVLYPYATTMYQAAAVMNRLPVLMLEELYVMIVNVVYKRLETDGMNLRYSEWDLDIPLADPLFASYCRRNLSSAYGEGWVRVLGSTFGEDRKGGLDATPHSSCHSLAPRRCSIKPMLTQTRDVSKDADVNTPRNILYNISEEVQVELDDNTFASGVVLERYNDGTFDISTDSEILERIHFMKLKKNDRKAMHPLPWSYSSDLLSKLCSVLGVLPVSVAYSSPVHSASEFTWWSWKRPDWGLFSELVFMPFLNGTDGLLVEDYTAPEEDGLCNLSELTLFLQIPYSMKVLTTSLQKSMAVHNDFNGADFLYLASRVAGEIGVNIEAHALRFLGFASDLLRTQECLTWDEQQHMILRCFMAICPTVDLGTMPPEHLIFDNKLRLAKLKNLYAQPKMFYSTKISNLFGSVKVVTWQNIITMFRSLFASEQLNLISFESELIDFFYADTGGTGITHLMAAVDWIQKEIGILMSMLDEDDE